jgi:YVTN family beta-propeller protein
MRSIQWLGLALAAVLLLLSGCSLSGGSPQPPSALSYTTSTAVYIVGTAIAPDTPTSTGGAVASYNVSPGLPAGLSLSSSTGIISGTPTTVTATAGYTVTASNSFGSATATLTITVNGAFPAQALPNMGQQITPLAPQGSLFEPLDTGLIETVGTDSVHWLAGHAVSTVVSPDGNTLLILTSGYNRIYNTFTNVPDWAVSTEYVFIYDISTHTPIFKQVVTIPNSYHGIAFDPLQPTNNAFYVSGGMGDFPFDSNGVYDPLNSVPDNVHVFTLSGGGTWGEQVAMKLALGHNNGGNGLSVPNNGPVPINSAVYVQPCAAGVAISNDGLTLVVANYYNDSITVFTGGLGNWVKQGELDLRPGKTNASLAGVPGGEYPFWVVVTGGGTGSQSTATAYVSSIRDREIDVVNLSEVGSTTPGVQPVKARIPVKGQPNKMTLNQAQTRLYVAEDQSDTVDVIDTTKNVVVETIPVIAPPSVVPSSLAQYTGANPNSVTLSPDETQLYVTNGNLNSIAVVALSGTDKNDQVVGLIPTGWYPNSVSFSHDGTWVYVVNGKSPTGPNPDWCYGYGPPGYKNCYPANEYNPQLTKAGFQSFPRPTDPVQLATLTAQVAANNRFSSTESAHDAAVMAAVHQGVQHVIFIIKENRTYDQILGDLGVGNGDPSLAWFGAAITPNQHQLARTFVTIDNFMDTSEVSNDGWPWTTSARAPDVVEHQYPVAYSGRGLSLDTEGVNRSVNVAIPTLAARMAASPRTPNDPDLLPGQTDVDAPDGPNNEVNTGYLWDSALRANLTVRDYGFFVDTTCYNEPTCLIPLVHDPAATGTIVAHPASASLAPYTDPYFRGFDPAFPDYYRYKEWEREFDANYATAGLPSLSLVRFMHDHTGSFSTAIDLVNTPETQEADNDYAVGLLVQKIANSVYANNTLIFVIEDDAQDGADHVDSHRSVAFVAGAYVKQGAVVSSQYNTLDFLRTIEEVLGLPPMNLNDALARPMADVFNTTPSAWSFTATPSAYLYNTRLPLPPRLAGLVVPKPTHDADYWARVTKGMDFGDADRIDFARYNRILWKGLMGDKPYPAAPTGADLRQNREELLADYRRSLPAARTDSSMKNDSAKKDTRSK